MKKSIFKRIGLIALAICVAIGSFFVPVTKKQSNNYASADSTSVVYTFNGSKIYIPFFRYDFSFGGSGFNPNIVDTAVFSISFTIQDDFIELNLNPSAVFFTTGSENFSMYSLKFVDSLSQNPSFSCKFGFAEQGYYGIAFLAATNYLDNVYGTYRMFVTMPSRDFTADIYKVELSNRYDVGYSVYLNYIRYYDRNDNYIEFSFELPEVIYPIRAFNYRSYLLDTNLSDNQIYNQGYQQGLADNQQNVYNNGYNAGFDVGFGEGRQDGIIEANDYSFISLIGSVIDVPVQTFMGLLNFTFLGVNLFDFICAILTFLLIIFIVKLFIGGK